MNQVAEQAAAEPPRTAVKDNPEAARLMARASALLAQGNIGAARIVLERAAETGSAEACFALAETYDPLVLSKWGTYGTRGEATKARELYRKAQAGGIQEANERINALAQ
jgi:TPR repeat protein